MNTKKSTDIALFRYGIIAPLVTGTIDDNLSKSAFFNQAASRVYEHPNGEDYKISAYTIARWYRAYMKNGFDGLKPQSRSDKATYRKVDEVKCVGTIRSIETFAYYSFDIVIDNRSEWCRLIENELDWEICFVMRDMTIGLAHPTDIFWNTEAIYEVFEDLDISLRIAYGIKSVFENYNKKSAS